MGAVKLSPRKRYVGFWGNRTLDLSSLNDWLCVGSCRKVLGLSGRSQSLLRTTDFTFLPLFLTEPALPEAAARGHILWLKFVPNRLSAVDFHDALAVRLASKVGAH